MNVGLGGVASHVKVEDPRVVWMLPAPSVAFDSTVYAAPSVNRLSALSTVQLVVPVTACHTAEA